ncbi:HinT-interacting membrane complex protein P80 [Mesomycoplasma flocculare]|uniref:Uncharacterized protein n=1 Tax=Mesomycoplasma flocculare ATCC 27399 TaxID=743971 RepID=A0A0A8E6D4_MESFC|nr:hypothetical protein [Mesomycoplasma flocculare]AJC49805.1 hypothetical protein MYF_01365 [Mesomycoplasma flocculare ATCC 27399]ENX51164.1 hypothetical protein MFC_01239 [Mesomycoplasma flocculare ATCC 27716]
MKKQNIFQKIANLNSDINQEKPKKNPIKMRKIWISIIAIASFLTVVGLGVGIPLYYSNFGKNFLNKRDPNVEMALIKSRKNSKSLKVNDLLSIFKSSHSIQRENLEEGQKYLIEFLYNQEYQASKVFQAAWESSNSDITAGNSRQFTLESFDEIRESQKKYLQDEKSRYQKTFGFNNWESEFNKYLNSDSRFNNAINFDQAVDALTIDKAKDIAFARFKLGFNQNFTKSDIEDRVLKDDIKDEKGKIVYKKGDKLFKGLIEIGKNGFSPNISASQGQNPKEYKVAAFLSGSYIKEYMNPEKIINEIYFDNKAPLKGNFNFFEISQISINAKPDNKDAKAPWELTKQTLEELLTYKILKTSENSNLAFKVSNNLELIEEFKGGNSTAAEQNNQDKILLSTINYEKNKENAAVFGKLPIVSLNQLLSNNEPGYIFAFLGNIGNEEPTPKLFSKVLFEKLKLLVFKNTPSLLVNPSELNSKTISEIKSLNERLKSFIQGLSDNQLKEAGKAFLATFGASEADSRTKLVYKIRDDLKLVLDSTGIKVLAIKRISNLNDFNEIIKKQLQLSANNQVDTKQNTTINLGQLFEDISNNDFIQSLLIRNYDYQNQILESKKTQSQQEKNEFLASIVQSSENYLNFYILYQVLKINTKLQGYISNATLNDLNADFWYNNENERWELKSVPGKELRQAIIEKLESLFKFNR